VSWLEKKLEEVSVSVVEEATRTRAEFAAGLTDAQRGLRIEGAAYRPLPAVTGVVYGGARRLVGWTVRETAGAAGVSVDLYDGADPGAVDPTRLVATFTIPAGGSVAHTSAHGISFVEGLYAVVSGAGALRGALSIGRN
jgi:hypothetical protein